MDCKQEKTKLLMLPWLAHGHISPYFELAKKLSQRNFLIYFCSTPVNLDSLREKLHDQKLFSSIHLVDLQLPSLPELPPHYHTTKNLPPHLMSTLKIAFDLGKPAFCRILEGLKPDIVVYDFLQPWAPEAANEQNIEAVMYTICGAASTAFFRFYSKDPNGEFPFPEFYVRETEREKMLRFLNDTAKSKERFDLCVRRSSSMVLIKTSREIEDKYVDFLSVFEGKEMVPVGPLVQEPEKKDDDTLVMEWLTKKEPGSVAFVSFGSEYFLSREERESIAKGLELSRVNFIWVVRFHEEDKTTIDEALPEDFIRRVEGRGLVLEDWAPQAQILAHESTGGFVSHCGWSSVLEGIMFGVPIIAMPMHLDQPLNARLVAEIGVGIEVPRENERYKSEEVARVIREAMVQEEGEQVRRKAKELSERMRNKGDGDIDVVAEKLVKAAKRRQDKNQL